MITVVYLERFLWMISLCFNWRYTLQYNFVQEHRVYQSESLISNLVVKKKTFFCSVWNLKHSEVEFCEKHFIGGNQISSNWCYNFIFLGWVWNAKTINKSGIQKGILLLYHTFFWIWIKHLNFILFSQFLFSNNLYNQNS